MIFVHTLTFGVGLIPYAWVLHQMWVNVQSVQITHLGAYIIKYGKKKMLRQR